MLLSFKHIVVLVCCLLVAAGCAFQSKTRGQGRFADYQSDANTFRVAFEGNTKLDADALEQSLLRRAAELTLRVGYTHFVVLDDSRQSSVGFSLRPGKIGTSHYSERSLKIRCYPGHPGVGDAVDAARFLQFQEVALKPQTL